MQPRLVAHRWRFSLCSKFLESEKIIFLKRWNLDFFNELEASLFNLLADALFTGAHMPEYPLTRNSLNSTEIDDDQLTTWAKREADRA